MRTDIGEKQITIVGREYEQRQSEQQGQDSNPGYFNQW
jgi:hypothetical protein